MIHNVDSYTTNITGHEHNLTNCVHKHSGKMPEGGMEVKSAGQQAAVPESTEVKMSALEYLTVNIKKVLGNGLGFLRGIWNESADSGEKEETKSTEKGEKIQNGNVKTEETTTLDVNGVFIFVGYSPNGSFLPDDLAVDSHGYIITNEEMETNLPGVFAIGDVRQKKLRQVTTAVGDGGAVMHAVEEYLRD